MEAWLSGVCTMVTEAAEGDGDVDVQWVAGNQDSQLRDYLHERVGAERAGSQDAGQTRD